MSIALIVFALSLNLVNTALTIAIYWITHKKVSEFIDIKSGVGQLQGVEPAQNG